MKNRNVRIPAGCVARTAGPDTDVLIAGGGMAGAFAAIGARARGSSVLLVEPHNVLGGQGTAGGVAGK